MVSTTSSVLVHEPFVIVHRSVTLDPAFRPVTVDVAEEGVVTVAPFATPTILHAPVPVTGALPARVKFPLAHCSWSGPAVATVGVALLVSTTSLNVVHEPLVIVQRKVALLPDGMPVTVVVADAVLVIVAVPDSTVQRPVPGPAAFAAIVKVPLLHCS